MPDRQNKIKIGIPRALSYYTFYPLWKTFLEGLGAEVIISQATNRKILEEGIKETVNDACIPIKVFLGHVLDLAGRTDYIFVPRMVSADGKATFCPKFLGLPDMVRYCGASVPVLIDARYNRRGLPGGICRFFKQVAFNIGVKNPLVIANASIRALREQKRYQRLLLKGVKPPEAISEFFNPESIQEKPWKSPPVIGREERITVALLGYPYAIFDQFISAGIYDKLVGLGVDVITFEQIPRRQMRRFSKVMPQNFFWYYSNQVCWAGLYLLENKYLVDGIVHITAFGCGPDAMVDKTLELEARSKGMPFLSLVIDEHSGEGGVQTRLEAFVDMLQAKRQVDWAG